MQKKSMKFFYVQKYETHSFINPEACAPTIFGKIKLTVFFFQMKILSVEPSELPTF
jgi:hypothetical protein